MDEQDRSSGGARAGARSAKYVACPTCRKLVLWQTENRFRPFCSERCKQIDLGAWAAGDYRIEGNPPSSDDNLSANEND